MINLPLMRSNLSAFMFCCCPSNMFEVDGWYLACGKSLSQREGQFVGQSGLCTVSGHSEYHLASYTLECLLPTVCTSVKGAITFCLDFPLM